MSLPVPGAEAPGQGPALRTLHVVHLEDDPADRELVAIELRAAGLACAFAYADAREGFIRALEEGPVDLILADFNLPQFDGVSALAIARRICPQVPYIFVSGTLGEDPAVETLKRGATDYVLKQRLGRLVPAVQRVLRDLREREELARSEAALQAAAQRLDLQFRFMPLALIVWDRDGCVLEWNPSAEATFGWRTDEVRGKALIDVVLVPEGRASGTALIEEIRAGRAAVRSLSNNVTREGRAITCEWFSAPLRDADGRIVGGMSMVQDTTGRTELERQLRQAQKMEAVGRLAGGVAHDFNNLLTVINSYARMAVEGLREQDPLRADLQEILRAGERAAALTRQLLAFSRRQVLEPRPVDLNALLLGMASMIRRLIGEDLVLTVLPTPGLDSVLVDPGQMEQVVMNLVVNARDAMPEGGELIIETANARLDEEFTSRHAGVSPGPHVLLSVSDTGSGMDEATRARLFEPFFTTKEPGKGTGLGLATVYGIVKQSGGAIEVLTERGAGSVFRIYLPRGAEPAVPLAAAIAPHQEARGSETVLVVEDEESVRRLVERFLREAGYRVLTAASGAEAIVACQGHAGPVHLLVSDVVMPRMSGYQLAEQLAALCPGLVTLFMSGYADAAIAHHGLLPPKAHFIAKPFSPDSLTRKVRQLLDERARVGGGAAPTRPPVR